MLNSISVFSHRLLLSRPPVMSNTARLILYFCDSISVRHYQLTQVQLRLPDVSKVVSKWWVFYLCVFPFPLYDIGTGFALLHFLGKIGSEKTGLV